MSVVLAGGGTAGHIEPMLALADALRRADPRIPVTCLGTERGLETRLVPMRGYDLELIPPVPLPRSLDPQLLSVPGRLGSAIGEATEVLDEVGADVVVGFGGYVSTPAYLAARRRGVPIIVHEANVRPGLANRIGARLTRRVFTGQRGTRLPHATYIGIPIRREIAALDRLALADKARAHFGLRPDLPVLLVTGGSQGARSLNLAAVASSGWIRSAGVQVLHIIGPRTDMQVPAPGGETPYVTLPYLDRMDLAYASADFALCRAGAMTCAELTAVGLPAAYVPLPHGNGEQRLNAAPIAEVGGGLIVDDAALTPEWIADSLLPVLLDPELVAAMSRAAAGAGRRDADRRLAAEVFAVLRDARESGGPPRGGRGGHGGHRGRGGRESGGRSRTWAW
ncbi:MAG TPA: undecaprenyldiphospho-muramoylpentapeptide beta-N-acetylglucosaminyltransferase [Streptosporangiaceae bacterium]|nr:undecaprenyldiphospho-muramoylpentapeptide beta-N-acetylglucosaminyltransferase [Streptosporangiaceae bacterium]